MKGADVVADVLVERGVDAVFTLCGNHLLPVYRALVDRGVRLVDTRSEASAVFAADGYARASRRPGVALVTGGPGFTNGLTGLVTAHTAGSPVLLLSGAAEFGRRGTGLHQEIDQVTPAAPLAKFAVEATTVDEIGMVLRAGLTNLTSSPSGAGSIALPLDVLEADTSDATADPAAVPLRRSVADDPAMAEALAAVQAAQRPLCVVGQGTYWDRAESAVAAYCQKAAVPILTMDVARGSIREDGQLCFGYPDTNLRRIGELIVGADVVLVLGRPVDHRFGRAGGLFGSARLVVVGAAPTLPGHCGPGQLRVDLSVLEFVNSLSADLDFAPNAARAAWLDRLRDAYRASALARGVTSSAAPPLEPEAIAWAIEDVVPSGTPLCLDSGDFVQWCRAIVSARGAGSWLRSGRMSTCGSGLPMALGAAVVTQRPVVAVTGDGSLGYGIADLETIARNELPVVCVVGNNRAWGLEYNLQEQLYGSRYTVASELGAVDFAAVARGFGVPAETVSSVEHFRTTLADALAANGPMLIEVPMSRTPSPLARAVIERGGVV